jgi:hypothetical protein
MTTLVSEHPIRRNPTYSDTFDAHAESRPSRTGLAHPVRRNPTHSDTSDAHAEPRQSWSGLAAVQSDGIRQMANQGPDKLQPEQTGRQSHDGPHQRQRPADRDPDDPEGQ